MQAVDEDRAVRRVHSGGQHGAPPVPRLPLRQRMLRVLPVHRMVPAVHICTIRLIMTKAHPPPSASLTLRAGSDTLGTVGGAFCDPAQQACPQAQRASLYLARRSILREGIRSLALTQDLLRGFKYLCWTTRTSDRL